jgi:protein-tyrosine phosphatase family protein
MIKRTALLLGLLFLSPRLASCTAKPPATQPVVTVGEKIPSEDPVLVDFHSLGLINGHVNIFRCSCPVRDLGREMDSTQPSAAILAEARQRMQRLYDLGIRTDISFQSETAGDDHSKAVINSIALEKIAAAQVGLQYVAFPMANSGKNSLQDMSDQAVLDWLNEVSAAIFKSADSGGVVFHCSAGHDRAGIVAAFLRIKYEHWPVQQAIDEMRRLGHNWPKFSANGGISSWHEDHLRAIAIMLGN